MTRKELARLESVNLREHWPDEAGSFTPWLARKENLDFLGKTLGIDLELEAQEKAVGPFRADILCKDTDSNSWVLIENQLEKTDHNHLGQLLTYASGLEAVIIIWIAERFTEEHRSTLDWLNRITDESFHFFGLEVELWRIGGSPFAPKFNIVSKPNNWSRSVVQAARGQLSEVEIMRLDYWKAFSDVLKKESGPISGEQKPRPEAFMAYPIGRRPFALRTTISLVKRYIRSELYIDKDNAKDFFRLLQEQRQDIEQELNLESGFTLEWEELPDRIASRVAIYLNDVDLENRKDWQRQHQWLATQLNEMHRVFSLRVKNLNIDDLDEL